MPKDDTLVQLGRMLAHPLRLRVLETVCEGETSPNVVAKQLGEPIASVAYHVRRLADLGAIKLTRTEGRRGAVEHYYSPEPALAQAIDAMKKAATALDKSSSRRKRSRRRS